MIKNYEKKNKKKRRKTFGKGKVGKHLEKKIYILLRSEIGGRKRSEE